MMLGEWFHNIKEGTTWVENKSRSGWPSTIYKMVEKLPKVKTFAMIED